MQLELFDDTAYIQPSCLYVERLLALWPTYWSDIPNAERQYRQQQEKAILNEVQNLSKEEKATIIIDIVKAYGDAEHPSPSMAKIVKAAMPLENFH